MIFVLIIWLIGAFLLFCVIYYGVRMGIDSSETSILIKQIHDKLDGQNNNHNN